jgi:hypothetical protein
MGPYYSGYPRGLCLASDLHCRPLLWNEAEQSPTMIAFSARPIRMALHMMQYRGGWVRISMSLMAIEHAVATVAGVSRERLIYSGGSGWQAISLEAVGMTR